MEDSRPSSVALHGGSAKPPSAALPCPATRPRAVRRQSRPRPARGRTRPAGCGVCRLRRRRTGGCGRSGRAESWARSSAVTCHPSATSCRMTFIMSIAVWNTIRLHSSEFHLTDFPARPGRSRRPRPSCRTGVQAENPLYASALLVAAVTRARSPESARNRSSATVRITRPTSRNAL